MVVNEGDFYVLKQKVEAIEMFLKQIDSSALKPLHTLGFSHLQAAHGDHSHFSGITISGSIGGNSAVASVVNALVNLGATDSTTP